MDTYDKLASNMLLLAHNPAAMQTLLLKQLQNVSDNAASITLRSPTDPVVFLAEAGVMLAHTAIEGCRATVPKTYPSQAQTMDDLFRHMSDVDYVDVFSQPSGTELQLIIDVDSLLSKAMPLVYAGVRKLVIPRDTVFKVSGYTFSIQYPIEIRVLPYGTADNPAFEVLWITETQSPISPVSTNALDWDLGSSPSTNSILLRIKIPVKQYDVKSHTDTTVGTNELQIIRSFTNSFFYARVWQRDAAGTGWVEIPHTHSRDVYDPNVATAVIQVVGQNIRCVIPSIYLTTGLVSGEVRMDVYTTMGVLNVDLSGYAADQFSWDFRDLNGEYDASYVNPLRSFSIFQVVAESGVGVTSGGRAELPFTELRDRVVNNAVGLRQAPITEKQLAAVAADFNLSLQNAIDYVTSRTYLMSAPLPASTLKNVSSPIGSVTSALYFSWDELSNLSTVRINDNRMTVLPTTLYKFDGSSLSVETTMTELLKTMRKEDLVNVANSGSYLFTPFHYVLDINNNSIDVRIYQLDSPSLVSKRFISTNTTTELSVVTDDYQILMTDQGYVLRTVTKSESPYQALDDAQVFAQLSFQPRNSETLAYVQGTLVGKQGSERVWEFLLETNLDVDRNDEMIITNTRTTSSSTVNIPVSLTEDFNIFYGCTGYYPKNYERATMDTLIVAPSRDAIGITYEVFKIELGKALTAYWRKARPITDSINYKYYEADVLKYYEADVVKTNERGVPEYTYDETKTPPLQLQYLHRKGDPVYDENGVQEILHEKGEQVKDADGNPVIDRPRSIRFRNEMAVFDARYLFADSDEVVAYRQSVIAYMINQITVNMPQLTPLLLERTDAYFVPITTMGYIDARTENGAITPIPAEQQFTVSYYLTAVNRQNADLIKAIQKKTSEVISQFLIDNSTVSAVALGEALQDALKDTILGVVVGGMGPDQDMRLFTVMSDATQVTVGKKMVIEANGRVGLKDDIVASYNRHDTTPV